MERDVVVVEEEVGELRETSCGEPMLLRGKVLQAAITIRKVRLVAKKARAIG